jgi:hypothetical protein
VPELRVDVTDLSRRRFCHDSVAGDAGYQREERGLKEDRR